MLLRYAECIRVLLIRLDLCDEFVDTNLNHIFDLAETIVLFSCVDTQLVRPTANVKKEKELSEHTVKHSSLRLLLRFWIPPESEQIYL